MPYTPTFINKYGWIWGIVSGAFFAGLVGAGVLHGETQSNINGDDIITLKIGQAVLTQKVDDLSDSVHGIAHALGVKQ